MREFTIKVIPTPMHLTLEAESEDDAILVARAIVDDSDLYSGMYAGADLEIVQ